MSDPGGFLDGLTGSLNDDGGWPQRLARIGKVREARKPQSCGIPACHTRITPGQIIERCLAYGWCHAGCLGTERRLRL